MKRKKKIRMVINIILIVLCILIVCGAVYAIPRLTRIVNTFNRIERDTKVSETGETPAPEQDTGYWNIMIFGLDSRDNTTLNTMNVGDYGDKRSDCMILVSINRETHAVKLMSLYRDTFLYMRKRNYYDTEGHTFSKATHAYFYGSANLLPNDSSRDAGPTFAIDMIQNNLDIEIDNFVSVNFDIVSDVIEALGGVDMEITEAEVKYINQYIDEINSIKGSLSNHILTPGMHHLDGVQATAYGRIRHTTGNDFRRTERQREVLMLTAQKAQTAGLGTLMDLFEVVAPEVRTDLTNDEILSLIQQVKSFNLSEENQTGFPFDIYTDTEYVYPNNLEKNVIQLHEYLYGEQNYEVSDLCHRISEAIREGDGNAIWYMDEDSDNDEEPEETESSSSGSSNYSDDDYQYYSDSSSDDYSYDTDTDYNDDGGSDYNSDNTDSGDYDENDYGNDDTYETPSDDTGTGWEQDEPTVPETTVTDPPEDYTGQEDGSSDYTQESPMEPSDGGE